MARRVLSGQLGSSLLLVLSLASCRHEQRAPTPSASASAAGNDFTVQARERHFQEELERARARWQAKPGLGDCTVALKEKADLTLCQAAASALAALAPEPAATPEQAFAQLAPAALALARLSQRLRYLSLAELGQRHISGDAAGAPASSASSAATRPLSAAPRARRGQGLTPLEPRKLELRDSPVAQLLELTIHLERDVVRNLGAYLEYGPLTVRRSAFDAVKRLRAEHPQWPLVDHLLRDAAVLEVDRDLKRALSEVSAGGLPQDGRPGQSTGTK